eukprot:330781_1
MNICFIIHYISNNPSITVNVLTCMFKHAQYVPDNGILKAYITNHSERLDADVIDLLTDCGADINEPVQGYYPIQQLIRYNYCPKLSAMTLIKNLDILAKCGADITNIFPTFTQHKCIEQNKLYRLQKLPSRFADFNGYWCITKLIDGENIQYAWVLPHTRNEFLKKQCLTRVRRNHLVNVTPAIFMKRINTYGQEMDLLTSILTNDNMSIFKSLIRDATNKNEIISFITTHQWNAYSIKQMDSKYFSQHIATHLHLHNKCFKNKLETLYQRLCNQISISKQTSIQLHAAITKLLEQHANQQQQQWNFEADILSLQAENCQSTVMKKHQYQLIALEQQYWIKMLSKYPSNNDSKPKIIALLQNKSILFQQLHNITSIYSIEISKPNKLQLKQTLEDQLNALLSHKKCIEQKNKLMQIHKSKLQISAADLEMNEQIDKELLFCISEHMELYNTYLNSVSQTTHVAQKIANMTYPIKKTFKKIEEKTPKPKPKEEGEINFGYNLLPLLINANKNSKGDIFICIGVRKQYPDLTLHKYCKCWVQLQRKLRKKCKKKTFFCVLIDQTNKTQLQREIDRNTLKMGFENILSFKLNTNHYIINITKENNEKKK